jgi:arsenate reductase
MHVIIYHNPQCGTSRNKLGLVRNAGIERHIIDVGSARHLNEASP